VLDLEKEKFAKELISLNKLFLQIKKFSSYSDVKENATRATQLKEKIDFAYETIKSFNDREAIFKQPISEYHDLNELNANFDPFFKLWDYCIEYDLDKQEWQNGAFLKLNFQLIDKKIDTYMKNANKLFKFFQD